MLVAPSDLEAPQYNFPATGFIPIPLDKIHFKTIVVASADDIWVSLDRAAFFAEKWGSEFINIGNAGHINAASGHTNWNEGMSILKITRLVEFNFLKNSLKKTGLNEPVFAFVVDVLYSFTTFTVRFWLPSGISRIYRPAFKSLPNLMLLPGLF